MGTRREVIASEAARLFAVRGYHGASLRDIAQASGVRQPTLYDHFPSKEALLLHVVHGYFDVLVPRLSEAAAGDGSAAERLGAMIRAGVEVGVDRRDAFLTTSNNWELIRTDPNLVTLVHRRDEAIAVWRSVLRSGVRDGSLRRTDTAAVLSIIASAVAGLIDLRYAETAGRPEPATKVLISVLVEGLAPR